MFKKSLAILLSLVMMLSVVGVGVNAAVVKDVYSDYPVILVPGYSGTLLDLVHEDGTRERVWNFDANELISFILGDIADVARSVIEIYDGNPEMFQDIFREGADLVLGDLKCDSNGNSIKNIQIAYEGPQSTNMGYVRANGLNEEIIGEPELFEEISDLVGEDNCFFFTEDWRMSVVDCAKRLDVYIQQVKEYTGKDKVNIIAVSHGGQVTATYLSLFGYKQDVDNAVLTVPAIGGAVLAYDIVNESVVLDEYTLVYYLEHGFVSEEEFKWLVEAENLGFLDDICDAVVTPAKEIICNFTSIWDFIPGEYYDELKAKNLDSVENAQIIAKSDYFHYEIMPYFSENLQKCIDDYGMNITIIAGYGVPSVTGLQVQTDGIIATNDSTGALCAPFGQRFNDGYTGVGTTCDDPTHDHVSPSFEVDASAGYIPENTWYVEDLFHGMTFKDEYTKSLAINNLLTDSITDIYSKPDYPQFYVSTNPSNTIYIEFDKSPCGYVSGEDEYITITNISEKYPVKITAVTCGGVELTAQTWGIAALDPGESVSVEVTGKLPDVSRRNMQIEVDYYCEGRTLTPNGTRTFNFMVMNGEAVEYDEECPYIPADYSIGFDSVISDDVNDGLKLFGVGNVVEFVYNWIMALLDQLSITLFFK